MQTLSMPETASTHGDFPIPSRHLLSVLLLRPDSTRDPHHQNCSHRSRFSNMRRIVTVRATFHIGYIGTVSVTLSLFYKYLYHLHSSKGTSLILEGCLIVTQIRGLSDTLNKV